MELHVTAKTKVAADTVRLRLEAPDGSALPGFRAGAHIELAFAGMARRYSLTSDPASDRAYEVCVLRTEPSRGGSAYLHDTLCEGEVVTANGPYNAFGVDTDAAHSVFIAGGIGITPFLSMMRALEAAGGAYELHYAARTSERFVPLPPLTGRVRYYVDQGGGSTLHVERVLRAAPADAEVYVCGPRRLIAEVRERALALGWPSGRVHFESFGPTLRPGDPPLTVHLALSGLSLEVPPGTPILDALLDAGVWAPYECRRGECASCTTEVLAGTPDHRDVCLTDALRRDQLCTCISWARDRELTLNL